MAPTFRTFDAAEAYLAKGRSKASRRVTSTRYLARVDDDTIALVLHYTPVVTYHRDGTFTIYGGGWNTVTTKRTIGDYSPVRIHSHEGQWIVGYTGETTPPRVQKCRTCRGDWQRPYRCLGPSYWDRHEGRNRCHHGETSAHSYGADGATCRRCTEGRADYGSKPVPVTVTADTPYKVDASGKFLGIVDSTPHAPSHVSASKIKPKAHAYGMPATPAYSPHNKGGEIVSELARVLPNLRAEVRHPVADTVGPLSTVIVSLNDAYGWTREQVADWLDTLDIDLRFSA